MNDPVTDAVLVAAENVPGELLLLGASTIQPVLRWSTDVETILIEASPAPAYRQHASLVARAWATTPALPGVAVASAIRAAVAAVAAGREVNRVSLVWTGPPTQAVGIRQTRAVVETIVANANHSLMLVSFASYRGRLSRRRASRGSGEKCGRIADP